MSNKTQKIYTIIMVGINGAISYLKHDNNQARHKNFISSLFIFIPLLSTRLTMRIIHWVTLFSVCSLLCMQFEIHPKSCFYFFFFHFQLLLLFFFKFTLKFVIFIDYTSCLNIVFSKIIFKQPNVICKTITNRYSNFKILIEVKKYLLWHVVARILYDIMWLSILRYYTFRADLMVCFRWIFQFG